MEAPARLYRVLVEAAAMQRWSGGWKDRGSRWEENLRRNGGVGGGEGVHGDKSGDGGTWCGGSSRGVYLNTLNVLLC